MSSDKLVIVFVIDIYDGGKNGTSSSARRTAKYLRQQGHEVRVVSTGKPEKDKFVLPVKSIPVVSYFADKQCFFFAEPVSAILRKAFTGADIVHLFLPLPLEIEALKIAKEMGIPCSSAFHLQPENITCNIYHNGNGHLAGYLYRKFNKDFYSTFSHIHCPSQFIANQLKEHQYQAKLHVISNGIPGAFRPPKQPYTHVDEFFHILTIGRLAPEKKHDLLIEAVHLSKYSRRIQLHFAGDGPLKNKLVKLARCLHNPPTFSYYQQSSLIELMHTSHLYVHPSNVEIEAIACLEAIACGLVPLISNSKKSATPQFALTQDSLFEPDNPIGLAEKIDHWIEQDSLRSDMSKRYAQSAQNYRIENSVKKLENMFHEVIMDEK